MKKIFLYFFAPSKEKKKLTFINTRNGGGLHSGGPGGGRGGHPRGLHATVAATREATLGLAGTRRVSVALRRATVQLCRCRHFGATAGLLDCGNG